MKLFPKQGAVEVSAPQLPAGSAKKPAGTLASAWPLCLLLLAATLAVYWPSGDHTFFILDENDHVTNNPYLAQGLTGAGAVWAFTSVAAFNWHPVTWLSHMAVAQCFGMDPRAHHLANVVIHAFASVVLFLLFLRLTGARRQSLLVAALFALHPLHVESVAWVAERKDVLSTLFGFLALLVYAEYVTKDLKPALYWWALVFFLLGLMSKSMLVTLPVVMLLLDFWPLGRYRSGERDAERPRMSSRFLELVREKIPFFLCSLVVGGIAVYAQQRGGATKSFQAVPLLLRVENSLTAYVKYLAKIFWPVDLGVLYPMPSSVALWQATGSLGLLLLITVWVLLSRRSRPYLAVGWFWFLVTLLPVIGLIQVGSQSMADRYTYIPGIGIFVALAWGAPAPLKKTSYGKGVLWLAALALIAASAALARQQLGYWRDSVSILRHTQQVTADNYLVGDMIGITLARKGDWEGAIGEFRAALGINPKDTAVRRNLAIALTEKGDLAAAIGQYAQALRIRPDDLRMRDLLAGALLAKGEFDAAIGECRLVLERDPRDADAMGTLEAALAQKRRREGGGN